jgi:apolipoprotein D and lipocalin family protein
MKLILAASVLALMGCSSNSKVKTADSVDLDKFMGRWYVLAGRFTSLEKDAFNSVEIYTWNAKKERIDIDFKFRKGSATGEEKSIPQTGWVVNKTTNAEWRVSPLWPLRFAYLVLNVDKTYNYTIIGVPSQKYFWIMARDYKNPEPIIQEALQYLAKENYDTSNMVRVKHEY